MCRKILPLLLVLAVSFSLTACVGGLSAEEIVSNVSASLADVTSYQFDMDMTMDASGEEAGETFEMTMAMDCSGALDTANQRMRMDIDISMEVPDEEEAEYNTEMNMAIATYIIDDMAYAMIDTLGMEPSWMKYEISAADWAEVSKQVAGLPESYLGLLDAAEVKIIGSQEVDGVDCHMIRVTPDIEDLWKAVTQQTQVSIETMMPDIDETYLGDVFDNFLVKLWITKDTYLLTKAWIFIAIEATAEEMGHPNEEGEMNMEISSSLLIYDYNQPIDIILPAEAEEAMEY